MDRRLKVRSLAQGGPAAAKALYCRTAATKRRLLNQVELKRIEPSAARVSSTVRRDLNEPQAAVEALGGRVLDFV